MTKSRKPKKPQPARLTITLENYAGIKSQTWVGTPKSFGIDWPIEAGFLLGERSATLIRQPEEIEMKATLLCPGSVYRCDHSK